MRTPVELISSLRLLPVVSIADVRLAKPLREALCEGGLPIAEITLRTDCALAAIQKLSGDPTFTVGAGTVLNQQQCREATDAGAQFIVSPGLDEGVVRWCIDHEVACYPGVCTPTELQRAHNLGLEAVKFFPAEAMGGVKTLKALSAPFPDMKFIPTGGICQSTLEDYLCLETTLAVGGSWMVADSLAAEGDYSLAVPMIRAATETVARYDTLRSRA